jgi:dTDP-4-amino-4,6-dideoxygalactose transaminase
VSRIWLSPPHMGNDERELMLAAFDSNWIAPLGPHVDAFETEMAARVGIARACALSSGSAALHLALILLGIAPGDPVVTSTLTFAATANAITYVGAEPVFVDSEPSSWTMDPGLLEEALVDLEQRGTPAKAVVTVDLYGQVCDYDAIGAICARRGIPIVEDAAEALGSSRGGTNAGAFGEMSALSFNGNKIITTSGGGMLLSRSAEHVDRARFLATQARDPAPHYQHSAIGYNYRLSNLLAAVGRGQLRVLEERIAARRANRTFYQEALGDLPGVTFLTDPPGTFSNAWLTTLTVDPAKLGVDRETIRVGLDAHQIESRPVWKPMHLQPVFERCRSYGGSVAAALFRDGLCLPSGSSLTDSDRSRIVAHVRGLVGAAR